MWTFEHVAVEADDLAIEHRVLERMLFAISSGSSLSFVKVCPLREVKARDAFGVVSSEK